MKGLRYRQTPPEVQASILQPHRAAQIEWLLEKAVDLAQARAAHHALFALTDERRAHLNRFDLLHDIPFNPALVLQDACPDLSVAAFDAELLRRNAALAEVLGV